MEAYWTEPDARLAFVKGWWAHLVIRRLLEAMVNNIPKVIVELGYDRPATP